MDMKIAVILTAIFVLKNLRYSFRTHQSFLAKHPRKVIHRYS